MPAYFPEKGCPQPSLFCPLKYGYREKNRYVIRGNAALYGAKSKSCLAGRSPSLPAIKKGGRSSILSPPSPRSTFFPLRIPPSTDARRNCVTAPSRPWQCQDDQLRTSETRHWQWQVNHLTNQLRRTGIVIGSARTKGQDAQESSSAWKGLIYFEILFFCLVSDA